MMGHKDLTRRTTFTISGGYRTGREGGGEVVSFQRGIYSLVNVLFQIHYKPKKLDAPIR